MVDVWHRHAEDIQKSHSDLLPQIMRMNREAVRLISTFLSKRYHHEEHNHGNRRNTVLNSLDPSIIKQAKAEQLL